MLSTLRVILAVAMPLILFSAACAPSTPELPSAASPASVADRVAGSSGDAFLSEITSHEWPDDGRSAGELFSWIPRDAGSSDTATADRAGATAHALAAFLASHYHQLAETTGRNPALIQSYATALIPYLGAMVGDSTATSGFEPLDGLDTDMPRTASVFAAIVSAPNDNAAFAEAANKRGAAYEREFAEAVVAVPSIATSPPQHDALARAARLLALVVAGGRLVGKASPDSHAETELAYTVVSRMLRGPDPHFSAEYFTPKGSLKPPDEIENAAWSLYDSQLSNYLATYPAITQAINKFGNTYSAVAGS